MKTRIEIFKNGDWLELKLKSEAVRYSLVANRMGSLDSRRISHSNTFELPWVSENIIALGIDNFSPVYMVAALNRKYPAKYYVKDKLLQKGFIVINNTIRGSINVNFIDEALAITEQWGLYKFSDLLVNLGQQISDFPNHIICPNILSQINAQKVWPTDKTKSTTVQVNNTTKCVLTDTEPTIHNKEIFLTRFPNTVDSIKSKWQLDATGIRKIDTFNPWQSRPIFSVYGFLYIICQAFGYQLRLDASVNQIELRDSYLIEKGIDSGSADSAVAVVSTTATISSPKPGRQAIWWKSYDHGLGAGDNEGFFEFFFEYPNNETVFHSSFPPPFGMDLVSDGTTYDPATGKKTGVRSLAYSSLSPIPPHSYNNLRSSQPDLRVVARIENPTGQGTGRNVAWIGKLVWEGFVKSDAPNLLFDYIDFIPMSVWTRSDNGQNFYQYIAEEKTLFNNATTGVNADGIKARSFAITCDKEQLNAQATTPVPGAPSGTSLTFVGVMLGIVVRNQDNYYQHDPYITDMHFTESIVPSSKTGYDKYGQLNSITTNLLSLAPNVLIKDLLSDVLQQQGLLLTFERDLNGVQNIVKFFSYKLYKDRVVLGQAGDKTQYYDWSEFHQRLIPPLYNTDWGPEYGQLNDISLAKPFAGNVARIKAGTNLTSQGFLTKLNPLVTNQPKLLNDITAVDIIVNSVPYDEYTVEDKAIIFADFSTNLTGTRKQVSAEQVTVGPPPTNTVLPSVNSASLPFISNIIYTASSFPLGVEYWYELIDKSVRCYATFLIPLYVIQNFDITKPVYIESLGGFYIVEEIPEYTDDITPIKISLIKVPL